MITLALQAPPSALSQDAWATLVAAFIGAMAALIVVVIQRWLEQRDRVAERNEQRRAIAAAILCEIDGLHRNYIRKARTSWRVSDHPFPVFLGNTQNLGHLGVALAGDVVKLYGVLDVYLGVLGEFWKYSADAYRRLPTRGLDKEAGDRVDSMTPQLEKEIREVCKKLSAVAKVHYAADSP